MQDRNQFRLFAHGENFHVDAYLQSSTLQPDFVWRRGEQRRYACMKSEHSTSGVEWVLGDGRTLSFDDQERIAIDFLTKNQAELRRLSGFPGADWCTIGLQFMMEIDEGTLVFCVSPSLLFNLAAIGVGFGPTIYVSIVRHESAD
jgi:hypothetical protein